MDPSQPGRPIPPTQYQPPPGPPGPVGPPGSWGRPPPARPRNEGGGGGVLVLVGVLGCLGLVGVIGAIALGFVLVRSGSDVKGDDEPTVVAERGIGTEAGRGTGPEVVQEPAVVAGDVERYRVPIATHDPVRGPDDALVTIVSFSDFECPFCGRVTPTIDTLLREYSGRIRVVWKDNPLPFHSDARPAALLAHSAREQRGDAAFWSMHDRLFENQRALSRDDLLSYARMEGLDVAAVSAAIDGSRGSYGIEEDQALARRIGARGTPTFFINGRELRGAQPIARFRELVDDELSRAQRLVSTGVAPGHVYDAITRSGRTSPAPEPPSPTPEPTRPGRPDPAVVHRVPVGDSPVRGPDDALVTIVMFSDFQCPFCSRVTSTLDQIGRRYGDDVRFVFKHNPLAFHRQAMPAAQAAVDVYEHHGAEAFWRMHDLMFENQRALSEADLIGYARRAGASGSSVRAALASDAHRARVQEDQELAAEVGARGTPTFFINGHYLAGAQPLSSFQAVIDRELSEARAMISSGTPRGRVYDTVMASATAP